METLPTVPCSQEEQVQHHFLTETSQHCFARWKDISPPERKWAEFTGLWGIFHLYLIKGGQRYKLLVALMQKTEGTELSPV